DAVLQAHQGASLLAFVLMENTGAGALIRLWPCSRTSRPGRPTPDAHSRWNAPAVLFLTIVTAGLMALTGNTGGEIRHPEILTGQETASAVASAGARLASSIQYFVADYSRWVWPALET